MNQLNFSTKLLAFSGCVGLPAILLFSIRAKIKKEKEMEDLRQNAKKYLQILKRFRKEFYAVFVYVQGMVQNVKQVTSKDAFFTDTFKISEIVQKQLFVKGSYFLKLIASIEERIHEEFKIQDHLVFKKNCLTLSKEDPIIDSLIKDLRSQFKSALTGKIIDPVMDLTNTIDLQTVLRTVYDLNVNEMTLINDGIHPKYKLSEKEFNSSLAQLSLADHRQIILRKNGFDAFEDIHSEHLLVILTSLYEKMDEQFCFKMKGLKQINKTFKEKMMAGKLNQGEFENLLQQLHQIANKID